MESVLFCSLHTCLRLPSHHGDKSPDKAATAEKHLHVRWLLGDLLLFAVILKITKLKEAH